MLLSSSGGEHIKMVVQDVVACVDGCVEMEVVVVVNVWTRDSSLSVLKVEKKEPEKESRCEWCDNNIVNWIISKILDTSSK